MAKFPLTVKTARQAVEVAIKAMARIRKNRNGLPPQPQGPTAYLKEEILRLSKELDQCDSDPTRE